MTHPAVSEAGTRPPSRWPIWALLGGFLAIVLIGGVAFARFIKLEERARLAENDAIARSIAAFILAREESYSHVLQAYAGRFRFREAITKRDRSEVLVHLRQLRDGFPELDRVFLLDPEGVLWAAYPDTPALYGKSFAHRDRYTGVSREWKPYVSDVYRAAQDQALSVALTLPIRDQRTDQLIGILGSSQRLETLRRWLLPIQIPGGHLYVVDRKGQLVFHGTRTSPDQVGDYAHSPVVERLVRGESGAGESENPVEGQLRLVAYRPLGWLGWGVVIDRDKDLAFHQLRTLMQVSGALVIVLGVALASLGVLAVTSRRRMTAALAALGERTQTVREAHEALRLKERAATEAREHAERATSAKSEFLSRMSHELRTPLNSILGFGQLLEMDRLKAEQRDNVSHILKAGRHLLALIDEVLDISRIEAGRLSLSPEPVVLGELLRETLDLVRPLADQRHIKLRGAPTGVWDRYVQADRQRLKQVLLNLASNAVKFSPPGQPVLVSCEQADGGRLRITVTDAGPGISSELLDRLFIPFERLGVNGSRVEGTGLGLALSKRLVDAMGGTIGVESVVGQGSTFWVELPEAERPPEHLVPPAACEPPGTAEDKPTGTVLYIEDNLANLRLLQRVVARRPSVRLLTAIQGRVGLELARQHRPDLILLDLHLPDLPGSEVLQRLRKDPETDGIPVMVISADATPGQIERLHDAGAQAFLTKPLDVRKLLALIDDVLPVKR